MSWEQAVLWLKAQPEHQELVQACFYDDPLLAAAERYYASTEWRAVRKLIGPVCGRALDVGSGRGISAFALAKDGWSTVALEPDHSDEVGAGAIRRLAAESHLSLKVVTDWGESLPFESASFDLVHCRQVLHHARDLRQLCREIARVLRTGGTMIATREHVISRAEDLPIFLHTHPLHHLYGGENAFRLEDYLTSLKDAGIQVTSVLNPFESDINLYPDSLQKLREKISHRLRLPFPMQIAKKVLSWKGRLISTPGRLFTLVGKKT